MNKQYLMLLFIVLIASCKQKDKERKITSNPNKITFEVNEGTEFLLTAFNLAVEKEMSDEYKPCETSYVKRLNDYFAEYKEHPFLKYIFDEVNSGTDFSSVGLVITNLETMELNSDIDIELIKRKIYTNDINNFRKLAADFYRVTKFNSFFKSNKEYYATSNSKIKRQVEAENLLGKIQEFYQDDRDGLEFKVFVELTNNSESQAVDFYDNYNPNIRAITLGNFCDLSSESKPQNEVLDIENYQGVFCHEISHLYTTSIFLDKYIGDVEDFRVLFDDKLTKLQIKDRVDHMIIRPLQAVLTKRIFNDLAGSNFYKKQPNSIEKNIYLLFSEYKPNGNKTFESYYKEAIKIIRNKG
ncbi:DUF4932 domain-containing protein [Aquimarina atlantica]|nr:DUF4932 domain-containing protein [Aquimarina atlantica]